MSNPFLALSTNIYNKLNKCNGLELFMTRSVESLLSCQMKLNIKSPPTILIADKLNRFGEYTFSNRSMKVSEERALCIGQIYEITLKYVCKQEFHINPRIVHWNEIITQEPTDFNQQFTHYSQNIQTLYTNDDVFKKLVDQTATDFIIYRSSQNSKKLLNKRHEIDMMIDYILEEIPVSAFGIVVDNKLYDHLLHPILPNHQTSEPILNII
eukprot:157100_1